MLSLAKNAADANIVEQTPKELVSSASERERKLLTACLSA